MHAIRMAGVLLLAGAGVVRAGDDQGATALFDGKTTQGWVSYRGGGPVGKAWVVEDGALHLKGGGGGDIMTEQEFDNFVLNFEWKVAPGSNSGVMYRVRTGDPASYQSGPEYQVLDDDKAPDGRNAKTAAASFYALYAPVDKTLRPVGEWNTSKIVVQGNHVEHWLNGKKVVTVELDSPEFQSLVAASKFKEWAQFAKSPKGRIVLQDHGDPVWYRNITIAQAPTP